MDTIYSTILNETLKFLLPIVLTALFGFLVQQMRLAQAKIKETQPVASDILEWLARKAVVIAESEWVRGLIQDKKQFAAEYIHKWLSVYKIDIDEELILAEIERAVYDQFNEKKINAGKVEEVK